MKHTPLLASLVITATLVGFGSHDGKSGSTQVVAKVNDQEITVHPLNFALSKVGKIDQT